MTDLPALQPSPQLQRVLAHMQTITAELDPALTGVEIGRALFARFGALEPRPSTEGVKVRPVDTGSVRGEWVFPTGSSGAQRIVVVHGGGFTSGAAAHSRNVSLALARLTGASVFGLDYRLAPEHLYPAALDDTVDAIDWVASYGPEGAATAASVVVVGESAGGTLAAGAVAVAVATGRRVADGLVLLSPLLELGERPDRNWPADPLVTADTIRAGRAAYLPDGVDVEDPQISPGNVAGDVLAQFPPTLAQATNETLLYDARRFVDRLAAAGVRVTLSVYPGLVHGWHEFPGVLDDAQAAFAEIAAFTAHVGPAARAAA